MTGNDRCMAVTGGAWSGPLYCGYPAKTLDANGRPICGIHRKGQPGIEWRGDHGNYPHGTGGNWRWSNGERR